MAMTVAEKLIHGHLSDGDMTRGARTALAIDQTLTQDATGTLVMLALEAMRLDRVKTEVSVQYVDHNLLQVDHKNPDDHLFLESACKRFGVWYSRPGNGVSHPVHMQRFGVPGKTLLGSDSHTCAAGSLGMLAIGAGGLDVAMAMAGRPFTLRMPRIWGIRLTGRLPDWVSAKDVILGMLRRHGVDGGTGRIIEYHGPGVETLSAMDRHVIANMGAELGATTTVFPSDAETRRFLESEGRGDAWVGLAADEGASYDDTDEIDLSALEPLIACPTSPGNVTTVRSVAGQPIYQAYIGSSANPGYRDFAIAAEMVRGRRVADAVSFDVNRPPRQLLETLIPRPAALRSRLSMPAHGCTKALLQRPASAWRQSAGGQAAIACGTCAQLSGRSGTREGQRLSCAVRRLPSRPLSACIHQRPRDLGASRASRDRAVRATPSSCRILLAAAPLPRTGTGGNLHKGPNIAEIPDFDPTAPDRLRPARCCSKVGDEQSRPTKILRRGPQILPLPVQHLPKIRRVRLRRLRRELCGTRGRGAERAATAMR